MLWRVFHRLWQINRHFERKYKDWNSEVLSITITLQFYGGTINEKSIITHLPFIIYCSNGGNTGKSNEININENLELENLKGKNSHRTNSFHLITHLNSVETLQKCIIYCGKTEVKSIICPVIYQKFR